MKSLPKLDISDVQISLQELAKRSDQLTAGFVSLGLQYLNLILGVPIAKDNYFFLRDAVLFRLNCIQFHVRLLISIQQAHLSRLKGLHFNSPERHMLSLNAREEQIFLFDSIVFHSISLFDYVGNVIGYLCFSNKQSNLKWNGVVHSASDTKNRFSSYPIAAEVISVHKKFVNKLYDHRSDLIHYKTDLGPASTSFDPMTAQSDFVVFAPSRFTANFSSIRALSKTNQLTLNYVTFWLCTTTIESAAKILTKLFEHLEAHRKVSPGKEPLRFGSPDGNKPAAP